jgi:hypothetical protein
MVVKTGKWRPGAWRAEVLDLSCSGVRDNRILSGRGGGETTAAVVVCTARNCSAY